MLDIKNKTYGRLTVIKYLGNNKHEKSTWLCRCECGKEIEVVGSSLISGNTLSCGCLQKEKAKRNKNDLSKMVFGNLTVIKDSGKRKNGNVLWECECICGNIVEIRGNSLLTGNTLSCGCINKEITIRRNKYYSGKNAYKNRMKGQFHYNWKGGITSKNEVIRHSIKYCEWRNKVFERDDYICLKCKKRGVKMQAHHIKAFSRNKENRFDIANGYTLCVSCHSEFHKQYGNRVFTESDFRKWIEVTA